MVQDIAIVTIGSNTWSIELCHFSMTLKDPKPQGQAIL